MMKVRHIYFDLQAHLKKLTVNPEMFNYDVIEESENYWIVKNGNDIQVLEKIYYQPVAEDMK